jgi:ankyrin repeat protein
MLSMRGGIRWTAILGVGGAAVWGCLTIATSAQTPTLAADVFQALRIDDRTALQSLMRDGGSRVKDGLGQTPLMLAAAFGSVEAFQLLVAAGADVRAVSDTGVTALHWAATNASKTRILLDADAYVDAVSGRGRTPLIIAASANGTTEVVRMLLARGANVNAADNEGVTPLIGAATVDNVAVVELLLGRGADVNAKARLSQAATPLMAAAANGNANLVNTLLSRGADAKAVSRDSSGAVKNGPILFGGVTALHFGVSSGNVEVVRALLAAGASVDSLDVRGMSPLMWSVATDRPEPRIIELLVNAGAQPGLRSDVGESTVAWVRKFNNPRVLRVLGLSSVAVSAPRPPGVPAVRTTPREAVARGLPVLREASARVQTEGGCYACHAQPITGMAVNLASARGWASGSADVEFAQTASAIASTVPGILQMRDGGGQPDGQVYATMMMAEQGAPPTQTTDALVHFLAAKQRDEGYWGGIGATRAPIQDGEISRTAMAIRALTAYATPSRREEYSRHVQRAVRWISAVEPLSTEDRVMQLLGLHWASEAGPIIGRRRQLIDLQRRDGGWSQTPFLESDAYATGQALYALHEVGVTSSEPVMQRGVAFLLRTQKNDGSWHVTNRAMKIQPYFESGFPYGHDQWISHAGTAWSIIGLASAAIEPPLSSPSAARR